MRGSKQTANYFARLQLHNRVRAAVAGRPPHTTVHAGPHTAVRRTSLSSRAKALGKVRRRPLEAATKGSVSVSPANSRRVSSAAPCRFVPVGTASLWSGRRRPRTLSAGGSLATRCGRTLPCSSSFGPSRLDWTSRVGTTTAADFCPARDGFRRPVPGFRASPTPRSDAGPRAG